MHRTIISDTSCLITLTNIGEIDLLRLTYGKIITTQIIADEFAEALPSWIEIKSPSDNTIQSILELQLDKGEASAITLALELKNSTVILDTIKPVSSLKNLKLSLQVHLELSLKQNKKILFRV